MIKDHPPAPTEERRFVDAVLSIWRDRRNGPYRFHCRLDLFGEPKRVDDEWDEAFDRGAFDFSVREGNVVLLADHHMSMLLARTQNDTLSIQTDEIGLLVDALLPDIGYADSLVDDVDLGKIHQMSTSFTVVRDRWEQLEGGRYVRTILEAHLHDISFESDKERVPYAGVLSSGSFLNWFKSRLD